MTHNDPDGPFGYVPTDPWGRSYEAFQLAERHRKSEALYFADKSIEVPTYPLLDIAAEYYRRAVANDEYARGVWEQVCERRGVAA